MKRHEVLELCKAIGAELIKRGPESRPFIPLHDNTWSIEKELGEKIAKTAIAALNYIDMVDDGFLNKKDNILS